jgi:hypothetical protein
MAWLGETGPKKKKRNLKRSRPGTVLLSLPVSAVRFGTSGYYSKAGLGST